MPNIREYRSEGGIAPTDRGVMAEVYAGRSIQQSYDEAGRAIGGTIERLGDQYVQHTERKEISKGSAALAELQDELVSGWKDAAAAADLNDDELPDKWRAEALEPALAKYAEGFTTEGGKRWAEQQVNSMRQHFYEKTAADQATRAGAALATNLDVLKTRGTNTVYNDPTSLNATLGLVDSSINGLMDASGSLTPGQNAAARSEIAREIKTNIVKAAVVGMIDANPGAAKAKIAAGNFAEYLSADQLGQLDRYADQKLEQVKQQEKADQAMAKQEAKDKAERFENSITGMIKYDDKGRPVVPSNYFSMVDAYLTMPEADAGTGRAMIAMGRSMVDEVNKPVKTATDPNTYSNFSSRMTLPPTDPRALKQQEVFQARADGRLSDDDFRFFNSATEQFGKEPAKGNAYKEIDDFTQTIKSSITQSNPFSGNINPAQDQMFYQFQWMARTKFDALLAAGQTPEQAKAALLDPRSASYLGKEIPRFAIGSKEGMALMQQSIQNGVPVMAFPGSAPAGPAGRGGQVAPPVVASPRKPGESPADYLKRTGGK